MLLLLYLLWSFSNTYVEIFKVFKIEMELYTLLWFANLLVQFKE